MIEAFFKDLKKAIGAVGIVIGGALTLLNSEWLVAQEFPAKAVRDSGSTSPKNTIAKAAIAETTAPHGTIGKQTLLRTRATNGRPVSSFSNGKKLSASKVADIEQALNQPAKFDFVDTPLREIASFLSEQYKIVVSIDKIAVEDAGLDVEVPLSGAAHGRTLRSALRSLFADNELVFLTRDEELLITTPEAFLNNPEKYIQTRLYDITDLASAKTEKLVEVIRKSIAPQSWLDTNGGPGTLDTLELNGKTIMVVNHTSNHHFRIEEFLRELRDISSKQ